MKTGRRPGDAVSSVFEAAALATEHITNSTDSSLAADDALRYPFPAPEGRGVVATGGASASSATRNPWVWFTPDRARPGGTEEMPLAGSYAQLLLHIVFSTKHRELLITDEIRDRLYAYIGGIIRAEQGALYAIGGVEDHVHLLVCWRADSPISDLMRTVKSRSTKWVKSEFGTDFAWQEGYAVFSVSKSQEDAVRGYIEKQAEHHRVVGFRDELIKLLDAHGVEFDARWIDE